MYIISRQLFILSILGAMFVLYLKYRISILEEEYMSICYEHSTLDKEMKVLRSEWSHLNDPSRLQRLSDLFLNFVPLVPEKRILIRKKTSHNDS